MKNVLVVMPFQQAHKDYIESIGTGCSFTYSSISDATDEQVAQADIIIGNASPEQVRGAEHLQWMQLNSAGADPYCGNGVIRPGTILTNATGAYGLAVSEHMVAASMMLCRKLDLYASNQAKRYWHSEGTITSAWNSTVLVLGLGDIGGDYARKMKALGSYVIGVRRNLNNKPDYVDELHPMSALDDLLPRADIVAMILPGTSQTANLMDEQRLKRMKKGSYLINAGRGSAVDCDALDRVLRSGESLAGCFMDVTNPEPLPADHPLWDAPRAIITPHVAGGFALPETFERIVRIAGENLGKFLSGRTDEMRNVIDAG